MNRDVEGNTKTSPSDGKKQDNHMRSAVITWNNYTETDFVMLETWCKTDCSEYVLGHEVGTCGTKHIQGFLKFNFRQRFSTIKKIWPKIHLEKCKSPAQAKLYCKKDNNYVSSDRVIKDPMSGVKWHQWQTDLKATLDGPTDDRKILWYYDEVGGSGKTMFSKHLLLSTNDTLYCFGQANNIKFSIAKFLENNKNNIKTIIYDVPRNVKHIDYSGLEQIKQGIFFNEKYESNYCLFDPPHLVVFSNSKPDINGLSRDRLVVIDLTCYKNPDRGGPAALPIPPCP